MSDGRIVAGQPGDLLEISVAPFVLVPSEVTVVVRRVGDPFARALDPARVFPVDNSIVRVVAVASTWPEAGTYEIQLWVGSDPEHRAYSTIGTVSVT